MVYILLLCSKSRFDSPQTQAVKTIDISSLPLANWIQTRRPNHQTTAVGTTFFIFCEIEQNKKLSVKTESILHKWGEISELNRWPPGPQPGAITNLANPTIFSAGKRFGVPNDTMACLEGLEPPTYCLEGSCSIQLS